MDWRICQKRRFVVVVLAILIRSTNVQFVMPMFQAPPPMFGMPAPMQMAMMQVQISNQQKKTGPAPETPKMQNNNDNVAVAIPVPMPMPLQMAVPAQMPPSFCVAKPRPPSCPPCPPCICFPTCTPAFYSYCSSCHQKCRCRDGQDAPVPLPPVAPMPVPGPAYPFPMPMPPPSIIVPVPPYIRKPNTYKQSSSRSSERRQSSSDSCSNSNDDYSSSSSSERKRSKQFRLRSKKRSKRRHHKNFRKFGRRQLHFTRRSMDDSDDMIKPVLSFVNRAGNIQLTKKITEDDVQKLTHDSIEQENAIYSQNTRRINEPYIQNVKVWADQDESKQSQLTVMSDNNEKDLNNEDFRRSNRQVILRKIGSEVVKPGRKELVFKPPHDKTISNLSVSFQVV